MSLVYEVMDLFVLLKAWVRIRLRKVRRLGNQQQQVKNKERTAEGGAWRGRILQKMSIN